MGVNDRESKMHEVIIDGVRFGDRVAELRKPGSTFYSKSYTEARSVAALLVDLDLAEDVIDVRRREPPAPDVEVLFASESPIFVEQTMVMDDDAQRFSMLVDDTNIALRDLADRDGQLKAAFESGLLTIRLDHVEPAHFELGISVSELESEVADLARSLTHEVSILRPVPTSHPFLHALGAAFSYTYGSKTASAIQLPMDHGRPSLVAEKLRAQIQRKVKTAKNYPPECRPLYLLLDIDYHLGSGDVTPIAKRVIAEEAPMIYDYVAVQQLEYPLLVMGVV